MRILSFIIFAFSFSAQASYMGTHCSNADGSVKWEKKPSAYSMTLKALDSDTDLVIPLHKVNIKFDETISIREVVSCTGGIFFKTRTYAGSISITENEEAPGSLDQARDAQDSQITTDVICVDEMNGRGNCI